MASSFDAAWLRAAPAIDTFFGEPFLVQPMMANPSGGRPIPDPSRPVMTIVGALTENAVFAYPETRRGKGSVVAQEATQATTIDIALDALPYDVQDGDRLVQVATSVAFKVNGPQPDGIARNVLRVVKMSSGS